MYIAPHSSCYMSYGTTPCSCGYHGSLSVSLLSFNRPYCVSFLQVVTMQPTPSLYSPFYSLKPNNYIWFSLFNCIASVLCCSWLTVLLSIVPVLFSNSVSSTHQWGLPIHCLHGITHACICINGTLSFLKRLHVL